MTPSGFTAATHLWVALMLLIALIGTVSILKTAFGDWLHTWRVHREAKRRQHIRRSKVAMVQREAIERLKDAA